MCDCIILVMNPDISQSIQELMNELENEMVPKSTDRQTKMYVQRFRDFLKSKEVSINFETLPERYLAQYLR